MDRHLSAFVRQYALVVLMALVPVVAGAFVSTAQVHAINHQIAQDNAAPRHMS